jgi:hypothetical protein
LQLSFSDLHLLLLELTPGIQNSIMVAWRDIKNFSAKNWGFVRSINEATNCDIHIVSEEYPHEEPDRIGFRGTRESVAEAKTTIKKILVSWNRCSISQ